MKKFFTLIAAVAMAASVNAQTLSFDTDYTAGNVPAIISANGLVLKVVDTNAKLVVDPNSAYFGTADSYQKFDKRLKSGGKSSSKNNLTLTLPSDGTLKVYARTGSSSATDRNVILTQNDTELANKILLESEAVSVNMMVDGVEVAKKVYPAVSVAVKAGDVSITYPIGSINFYGFEFVAAGTSGISTSMLLRLLTMVLHSTSSVRKWQAMLRVSLSRTAKNSSTSNFVFPCRTSLLQVAKNNKVFCFGRRPFFIQLSQVSATYSEGAEGPMTFCLAPSPIRIRYQSTAW